MTGEVSRGKYPVRRLVGEMSLGDFLRGNVGVNVQREMFRRFYRRIVRGSMRRGMSGEGWLG